MRYVVQQTTVHTVCDATISDIDEIKSIINSLKENCSDFAISYYRSSDNVPTSYPNARISSCSEHLFSILVINNGASLRIKDILYGSVVDIRVTSNSSELFYKKKVLNKSDFLQISPED